MRYEEVGRVRAIYRYPVKSMRGEEITEAELWWHGLNGDRKCAFVRVGARSGFPWLTGRDIPDMIRYEPRFADPADPVESRVIVRTPQGLELPLESEALHRELAEQYGGEIELIKLARGTFDSMSVSMLGVATLGFLSAASGVALEPQRFRPNLLVEADSGEAFAEEGWIGARVIFGDREDSAAVTLQRRNVRCMMITLDPATAQAAPQVLRTVARERDTMAGIYGSTERPGTIRAGDSIRLVRPSQ
ncbi:MAG TPA: MOSC N-terminal beta barrel domain-containing protein [Ardenticatenaceae bacterium]|nr:MOSC N-terminal beta barrel domain-containing protein [Ardenticatenaceae bacterium]